MHKPYLILTFAVLLLPIYGHGNIEKPQDQESQSFGEQVVDFSISKDEIVSAFNARKMRWDLIPFKDLKNRQEFIWKGQFYLTDKKTNGIFTNNKIDLSQLGNASIAFDPKTKFINPKYDSIVYVLGKNKRHSFLYDVLYDESFSFQGKVFKQISKRPGKIKYQFTGNVISKVEETFERVSSNIAELQVNESCKKIIGTLDHPFFVSNRNSYVQMKDLSIGDRLISDKGNILTVKSKSSIFMRNKKVFNLKIKATNNYYVHLDNNLDRNLLIHNANYKKSPVDEVKKWIETEPGVQDPGKVKSIRKAIESNDPWVWRDPVYTTRANGNTYLLDGHHRVNAAKGVPGANVPHTELTHSEISNIMGLQGKWKLEEILSGLYD